MVKSRFANMVIVAKGLSSGHRTPDFAPTFKQIDFFFQAFKVPLNSGSKYIMCFPLRSITGDASEISQVILK